MDNGAVSTAGAIPRPPDEQPVESRYEVNGTQLAVAEWPGEGPPILLVHATGFHRRCWDRVVAHLPGRRAFAVDLRGHGLSEPPPSEPAPGDEYTWDRFGEDLLELLRVLDLRGAIGVGHSMGGHVVMHAAGEAPERFAGLVLVDTVVRERDGEAPPDGMFDFIARRRDEWPSPEVMVERFADRFPFSTWDPRVLRDYCVHGLLPQGDRDGSDGYVLACPPAFEASTYGMTVEHDINELIRRINVPVRVLRAGPEPTDDDAPAFSRSPTPPDLASRFTQGEDVVLRDLTHFIPMQAPALTARHIEELAGPSTAER